MIFHYFSLFYLTIDILISEDMTEEDALEYFYYNVSGAYVGEKTPIWCDDMI